MQKIQDTRYTNSFNLLFFLSVSILCFNHIGILGTIKDTRYIIGHIAVKVKNYSICIHFSYRIQETRYISYVSSILSNASYFFFHQCKGYKIQDTLSALICSLSFQCLYYVSIILAYSEQ